MSQAIGGIDLLLFFSTGHLKIVDKDGGVALARSDELLERIPTILEVAEQFLYYANDFKFDPNWSNENESSGSDIQN